VWCMTSSTGRSTGFCGVARPFAVVEDHRVGLVPKKLWPELRRGGCDGVGGNVDQLRRRRPGGLGEDLVDLVPWQVLVGGDGEAVPDSLRKP
jgi:hypothetical protein